MKERQRWQPGEDAILRAYVKQYGPKEWNLISQRMGKTLNRDPKSCLERWKNYLKPGIKKGSLTPDEQSLVISLQAKYGNKWKKIASEVPGRTAKRLGKWWEVFKEKQLKQQLQKKKEYPDPEANIPVPPPENVAQGKYDHILETFAEKYVQPKLFALQSLNLSPPIMPNIGTSDPDPVLSLGSTWMNTSTSLSSSTPSSTPSPSVSLSLSPSEPGPEPSSQDLTRFMVGQQMGSIMQYYMEIEDGRQNWLQHKKEATWRLSRLEQQLESEKARKRREKMEEVEAKIRRLREEEMEFVCRIESECREQLCALQRDAESMEAKLMEAWSGKHVKLAKLVEQIGVHCGHVFTNTTTTLS
ncbi:Myb_DNA-bind_6 domain-containing protein [Cephalotus follicularis]|uniref:Myb_DNA-bind_6 domain-containing protein n=1 Tax=Cephalotus follicularis TaxID=3775 RepID=A0A1Q3C6C6_CEPFO|nr:Myb_DNA-bind_6 domain-containing protein [Cephalotus follicularis]